MSECVHLQVENQMYPVTVDALTAVFSPYGGVQKIAIFEKQGTWQVGLIGIWLEKKPHVSLTHPTDKI